MSVNRVILVGNVGKDPEVKTIGADTKVAKFSMATSESYKNKAGEKVTDTTWHNIVVWRALAGIVEKYVSKGSKLYVEGKISNEKYTDKSGVERYTTNIVAENIKLLGGKKQESGSNGTAQAALPERENDYQSTPEAGDDLPF